MNLSYIGTISMLVIWNQKIGNLFSSALVIFGVNFFLLQLSRQVWPCLEKWTFFKLGIKGLSWAFLTRVKNRYLPLKIYFSTLGIKYEIMCSNKSFLPRVITLLTNLVFVRCNFSSASCRFLSVFFHPFSTLCAFELCLHVTWTSLNTLLKVWRRNSNYSTLLTWY